MPSTSEIKLVEAPFFVRISLNWDCAFTHSTLISPLFFISLRAEISSARRFSDADFAEWMFSTSDRLSVRHLIGIVSVVPMTDETSLDKWILESQAFERDIASAHMVERTTRLILVELHCKTDALVPSERKIMCPP